MEADNLEAALSVLDEYMDSASSFTADIDEYHEVAELAEDMRITVEQLEREREFNRDVLLKHIRSETKHFFQQLFGSFPSIERVAFAEMQSRLKETEHALNDTLQKRNQLETERIQLLDQVAELRVTLARVHSHESDQNETLSTNGLLKPRPCLPLHTSSPIDQSVKNRIVSPDEGIEGTSVTSESCASTRPSSQSSSPPNRSFSHLHQRSFNSEVNGIRLAPANNKAISTPNLNNLEPNQTHNSCDSFDRDKNQKSFRKFFSAIRIGTQESLMGLKTPKFSRAVPQCGRPTGLEMGGVHRWDQNQTKNWLRNLGLEQYSANVIDGSSLLGDPEKLLNITNEFHKKKLRLAIRSLDDDQVRNQLDTAWVCSWLDEIGLPEYKANFHSALIDGRVLNLLTMDELMTLGVTSQLHYLSIKRGIQVLRQNNFNAHTMICRPSNDGADLVERWSLYRIMEWLRSIELAEFAPNLRGSGIHGGLICLEPGFGADHFAALLDMSARKTLLRKHLQTNFNSLLSDGQFEAKREYILRNGMPMPLTVRLKRKKRKSALSRQAKKSIGMQDEELVCPLNLGLAPTPMDTARRPSITIVPPQ